jgi:hypothetical protein
MSSSIKICLLLLFALSLTVMSHDSAGADRPSLTMQVTPTVNVGDDVTLTFRLRYQGSESITADISTLPGVQKLKTVFVDAGRFPDRDLPHGTKCGNLKEVIMIDDPGLGSIPVAPGQEFVETVHLSKWYLGLENVLGRCEIVVNWSYKLYAHDDTVGFPRMAGSVVIPSDQVPIVPPDIVVYGVQKPDRSVAQ